MGIIVRLVEVARRERHYKKLLDQEVSQLNFLELKGPGPQASGKGQGKQQGNQKQHGNQKQQQQQAHVAGGNDWSKSSWSNSGGWQSQGNYQKDSGKHDKPRDAPYGKGGGKGKAVTGPPIPPKPAGPKPAGKVVAA